jgi:hypothetical protein
MHYKGTGNVHSFRGLLADGDQRKIRIQGATGEIAWRITKFQTISNNPGGAEAAHVLKLYREKQSSVPTSGATIDFTDDELLAAIDFREHTNEGYGVTAMETIFDNSLFSRNIYVTHTDNAAGSISANYYIELEEIKVSAAGMAQLAVAAARRTID